MNALWVGLLFSILAKYVFVEQLDDAYRYNFLFLYLWIHIMYHFIQNRLTLVLEYVHVRHCLIATDHKCVDLTIRSRVHSFFARQALGDGCITASLIKVWSSYGIWFGNSKWALTTRSSIYNRIIVPECMHLRISKKYNLPISCWVRNISRKTFLAIVLDKKPLTKNMRKTTLGSCVSILLIISNP